MGRITSTRIIKSSDLEYLDSKCLKAMKNASFYPYRENGAYYSISGEWPLNLKFFQR